MHIYVYMCTTYVCIFIFIYLFIQDILYILYVYKTPSPYGTVYDRMLFDLNNNDDNNNFQKGYIDTIGQDMNLHHYLYRNNHTAICQRILWMFVSVWALQPYGILNKISVLFCSMLNDNY